MAKKLHGAASRRSGSVAPRTVEALRHPEDKRKNIPTAEHQSVLHKEQEAPREIRYPRNTDLDPQLMWRGKDYQDWSDLVVQAPPLYIQEKIHPKVLIDDLLRQSKTASAQESGAQFDLFGDFNGLPKDVDRTEFYQHEQNWSNRMILGDSLQVMASLAEREGLRGKVQCIYIDPPYGIRFNSNFQWSTTTRDVRERADQITRQPEQVKAFRDTWRDGIHSYLSYLRDRLTLVRDLLTESGSVFVQIGDENQHRVWALLDEIADEATFTMPSGAVVPAFALVEWEVPREPPEDWPAAARQPLADFWIARIGRQKEIDASIAAKAEFEYLYDRPYEDKKKVRVAGPFTVESLSPHRMLGVDENDELIDPLAVKEAGPPYGQTFEQMILDNLKVAGVQQAHKEDKISFTSLTPWPGELVCAEGRYREGDVEKRAAIFIGPEFGTVSRPDLVAAAREAGDAVFDVLIACAFNYEAHATEFSRLGRIPVLKARMNADLHMAGELKPTSTGNLFVIFGEPTISILEQDDGRVRIKLKDICVFDPSTGQIRSSDPNDIACWFIDTDYNEESFFVRHAYFLGQNDPYGALKTTLKAEINADAWETLHSDTSRPFVRPKSGRIAVKVINHLGDEVMKVFRVT
jgi:hypothetical protein